MSDGRGGPVSGRGRRAEGEASPGPVSGKGEKEPSVDRVDYDPTYDPAAPVYCEVCGGEMYYTAACKLKCPRCGYMRDCSDP